jgi:hypothetical protein
MGLGLMSSETQWLQLVHGYSPTFVWMLYETVKLYVGWKWISPSWKNYVYSHFFINAVDVFLKNSV